MQDISIPLNACVDENELMLTICLETLYKLSPGDEWGRVVFLNYRARIIIRSVGRVHLMTILIYTVRIQLEFSDWVNFWRVGWTSFRQVHKRTHL